MQWHGHYKHSNGQRQVLLKILFLIYMLSEIDAKIQQSQIKWNWRHVRGHHDDQFGPLEIWAILNIECDTAVKQIWDHDQENLRLHTIIHKLEKEVWRIYSNIPINDTGKQKIHLGKNILKIFWTA